MATQDVVSATAACVGTPVQISSESTSENSTTQVYLSKAGTLSSIGERVKKVSEFSGIDEKEIFDSLTKVGIDDTDEGLKLLNSDIASVEVLEQELSVLVRMPVLKRKAAIAILKGNDPFKKDPPERKVNVVAPDAIAALTKALRNIGNMSDQELIDLYDRERDLSVEQEIDKRAKHQPVVILTGVMYEPGKEQIDLELTCDQLKRARKGYTIPSMIPGKDKKIVRVYRITELNPDDRIVELCPICGEILYKGYCPRCELDFSGIPDDERAYVSLIVHCEKFNRSSHSDRKAVHASASKNLENLKTTWPSIAPTFEDLKLTNSLPKLRMIKNIPATQVADPFHVSGHRSF
jgi:hypothetical protein